MKDMSLGNLKDQLAPLGVFLKKYASFIVTISILVMLGYVVYRINTLSALEPSESLIDERRAELRTPKIDEDAISTIEALQDRSTELKALFDEARDNPFQE